MNAIDRQMPPLNADERKTMESWLDFYRATLAMKCEGLAEEQLRSASVPPSPMTLIGLLQHASEVERNWFRRVLAGEDAPPIYSSPKGLGEQDKGFELLDHLSFEDARSTWQGEVARSRANCAVKSLDDTAPFMDGEVSLRWIYTHMIAEYARHCGHADLVRERIDGSTGH